MGYRTSLVPICPGRSGSLRDDLHYNNQLTGTRRTSHGRVGIFTSLLLELKTNRFELSPQPAAAYSVTRPFTRSNVVSCDTGTPNLRNRSMMRCTRATVPVRSIMTRIRFSTIAALVILCIVPSTALAVEGFPILVKKNATPIKVKTRVVGTAGRDMLLWVSKLSEDEQWAWVKVPASDQSGWMHLRYADSVELPPDQQQSWDEAAGYFSKWESLVKAGQVAEAAAVAKSAGDRMNSLLEQSIGAVYPGYPPAATAYNQAGVAMLKAGELEVALKYFQDAMRISRATLGTRHAETCVHQANLAETLVLQGKFAAAIGAFDISLPVLEQQEPSLVSLDSYFLRYGMALANEHRIFDARLAFGKALQLAISRHGERSVEVARVASQFAAAIDQAGQHADAVKQLNRSLEIYRQLLDPEDPGMIDTLNRLSAFSTRAENFRDAKEYATEAVEIQRNVDDPPVFQLASSLNNLGLALTRLREFDAAEPLLREAHELMVRATAPDSFLCSYPLKNLGILALERGDCSKANELLQRVLEIREATQAVGHASIGAVKALLGKVAVKTENFDLARKLFIEAVRIQGKDLGIDHPDTRKNIAYLRTIIGDDRAAHEDLDLLIVAARRSLRRKVVQERPEAFYQLGAIEQKYRLQRVLAGRQASPPAAEFYPLEVTEETSVRTGGLLATKIPAGSIVYAFRAENGQALIKVPGKLAMGWIAQESVREVSYSAAVRAKLEAAQQQLDLGWEDREKGDFKTATTRLRSAISTFEDELGKNSAYLASARYALGAVLSAAGESRTAVEECQQAEAVLIEVLGEHHGETAMARNNLADALLKLGRPAEALRPAALALQTISGFGDENKSDQALLAGNTGLALGALSHYEAAREYLEYALKLAIEANGENHKDSARCYSNLGELHVAMYEFEAAEESFGKAFRILERVAGRDHPVTTTAMMRYGEALVSNQKIPVGRKLIERAAQTNLQTNGPLDLSTIEADFARARLALNVGDTTTAKKLMTSVVERAQKRLGDDSPAILRFRRALGEILYMDGAYEPALAEVRHSTEGLLELLGEENHQTIESINATGVCNAALGRLDVARVSYEQALRLGQKILGPDHPDTTAYMLNIGEVALMAKDYVAARPRIEAAIEAFQQSATVVRSETSNARTMLGYVDIGQNDTRAALKTFDMAARDTFKMMSTVLPALSEKEQLMFLNGGFRNMYDAWLTLSLADPDSKPVSETVATWHLNMKGSSHELLATQAKIARDSTSISNKKAFQDLIDVREKLARLSLRAVPPDALASHDAAIRILSADEERLSREIGDEAARVKQSRSWIDLNDYRTQMPASSVLVNFARIRNANYQYSSERSRWKGDRYVAWVIPADGIGKVAAVDLGLADGIDRRIATALEAVHSTAAVGNISIAGESTETANARKELSTLADKVLQPLLSHIGNVEELILSPDGQLWTIPWSALPISDKQLALERFRIRLVVSGREIANKDDGDDPASKTMAPVIVANPSFDRSASATRVVDNSESNRLRSINFRFSDAFENVKALPGTAAEAEAIRGSIESYSGVAPQMYQQQIAEEAVVKSAQSPHCLVLSTHGFFFESARVRAGGTKLGGSGAVSDNPLLRCGLLLAGCHHANTAPPGIDDGILTGMEIISSDLRNTELVVLSACETGLGDLRSGEGVAGLRQAFQLAGAKSVVASLWQVEDQATARLMDQFFKNLAAGMSKSEALRSAQLSRIKARRERNGAAHPFFWAAFTLTGVD